jgi:hypothetical protein
MYKKAERAHFVSALREWVGNGRGFAALESQLYCTEPPATKIPSFVTLIRWAKQEGLVADVPENFWSNTRKAASGCTIWTGTTSNGFGWYEYEGKGYKAHRFAAHLAGLVALTDLKTYIKHTCENWLCCNEEHFEVQTRAENMHINVEARSKLTKVIVQKIRSGELDPKIVVERLGVTPTCIYDLMKGRSWAWLDQEGV